MDPVLSDWGAAFQDIINERSREKFYAGMNYMVNITNNGYTGFCPPLMLSSYQEQLACGGNFDHFNWFRVSPFDPRIRNSEWLDPGHFGAPQLTELSAAAAQHANLQMQHAHLIAMPLEAEDPMETIAADSALTSHANSSEIELADQDFPHYRPGTVEYNRSIRLRPDYCNRCIKQDIVCLTHLGYAPCVPCKPIGGGCHTKDENAITYHTRVYKDVPGDFHKRKLKPAIRVKYEASARDEKSKPRGPAIEGGVSNKKLMGKLQSLGEEIRGVQVTMERFQRDMSRMMAVVLGMTGRTDIAPSDEPVVFPAQETPSTESTSKPQGGAIHTGLQGDVRHGYGGESSSGPSARSMGERWRDLPWYDELMGN